MSANDAKRREDAANRDVWGWFWIPSKFWWTWTDVSFSPLVPEGNMVRDISMFPLRTLVKASCGTRHVKQMLRLKTLPMLETCTTKPKTCLNNSLYILIKYKTQIFTLCISVGVPQWTVRVMSVVPSLSVVKDNMTHLKHNRQEVKLQSRSLLLLTGTDRQSPPGTSHQPSAYGSTHSLGWKAEKQEIQQPFSKCRCRDERKT